MMGEGHNIGSRLEVTRDGVGANQWHTVMVTVDANLPHLNLQLLRTLVLGFHMVNDDLVERRGQSPAPGDFPGEYDRLALAEHTVTSPHTVTSSVTSPRFARFRVEFQQHVVHQGLRRRQLDFNFMVVGPHVVEDGACPRDLSTVEDFLEPTLSHVVETRPSLH